MIFSGAVRRIDDLGRVCIPKEVRKMLNIEEGDALEVHYNQEKTQLILKKYNPEPKEQIEIALENALDFLESMPAPPIDIIKEIHKALEIDC